MTSEGVDERYDRADEFLAVLGGVSGRAEPFDFMGRHDVRGTGRRPT
jgi:hypothetical protein